jgi:filamentous hemagglutinin family protein
MVRRCALLHTAAFVALLSAPIAARAGPEGGAVTSGSAAINSGASETTINQSSDRAIIRWDSFDLDSSESVRFNQPSSSSITVNRIRDVKPSRIDGHISANGNIVLINPNGMVFGETSTVDVGGLVATSSDLADDNEFMAGGAVRFNRPGNPNAKIIQRGQITVKQGGLVGLVAPNVENHGVIEAKLGKVQMASGDIATIDFAGDGLIKLEVTDAVLSQRVLNAGTITAEGGSILLTAAQARGMVDSLVVNSGTLRANTVTTPDGVQHKGTVILSTKGLKGVVPDAMLAEPPQPQPILSAIVENTGRIEAQGLDQYEAGGDIIVLSDNILIGDGSYVTASGDADGGRIRIGGEYQGGPGLPSSDKIYVSQQAILDASSRRRGLGGTIIFWSDTITRFYGHAEATGGAEGGDGGLIEVSSKGVLAFAGTVNLVSVDGANGELLLDPTDIVISDDPDSNMNAATPFSPTVDDGPSVLNTTTLLTALASASITVQTRATGTQAGNITVDGVLNWTSGNTLTLNAHNDVIVNQTITGKFQTYLAGNDLVLNANIAGSDTLTMAPNADNKTVGIGAGSTGVFNLSASDLSHITNGWKSILIGRTTSTSAMDVQAGTWADPLTFRTGTGQLSINGVQNMGANNLTLNSNGNMAINAALNGTGGLTIAGTGAATSIAIGTGQTGTLLIDDTELGQITDGWSSIVFGTTSVTGTLNVGARTWNDSVFFRTGSGALSINGTQNVQGNNLTITSAANPNINANLMGTGTLSITGAANSTTIAVGTGQTGTVAMADTELDRIVDGWANIIFGSTAMTGVMNVAARTWNDSVEFRTNTGALNLNGVQNVQGNNITIRTNTNLAISNALTGTGTLSIMGSATTTTMGIGTGQAGTIALTDTELSKITNGWANIIFGRTDLTAAINVGAYSWNDSVEIRSKNGTVNINGAQTMGANNLALKVDSGLTIGAALSGSGTLTIAPNTATSTIGVGTGQSGTLSLSDTSLGNISNGWGTIIIGSTAATGNINVGARTWNDNVIFTTGGTVSILGAQSAGANDITINGGNATISAALAGTGTLTFSTFSGATTLGIGTSATGTFALSNTELAQITDGWSNIVIGRSDGTGAMTLNAYSWNDNLTLLSGSGVITVNGAQSMGANNLTISTNANLALSQNLSGTGNLVIKTVSGTGGIGIGNTQTGSIALTDTELSKIVDGWATVTFGSESMLGAINIGAYGWVNPMRFVTLGNVVLNGAQTSNETSGTSLVYATISGSFINNAGASAINPGGGRYLVYSVDQNNDTLGGINRPSVLLNKTYAAYGPGAVVETGSIHLYSGAAARILYLQIDDKTKIYGDILPGFTYTYLSGLQGSDTLSGAISSYTLSAAGASVFDNTGTTRAITGNFTTALGYTTVVTNGTLSVAKADLTVTADSSTREYGLSNPALSVSYSGFKNGDDETDLDALASASTAAVAASNVGSYATTASGGSDNNYNYIYVDGSLAITKAMLTATMQNTSRVYGDANPTFTANYTGFRNGDTATVIDTAPTGATAATATSNVGTYIITGSGAVDNNYNFTYVNGTLTVNKAILTVTGDNKSREYGDANPAFTVSYSGFKNGETSSVIDALATATSAADATSNAGTYAITASGATDNNYSFSYVNGTLTVNKAVLTATANNASREYGDADPGFTFAYSGFKNGENSSVIDTGATGATAATATSNIGTYAITGSGATDNNYSFSYVNGTLTINKATLTATADNKSREYGDTNPGFTFTYTGFKNGENASVIDTGATGATAANTTSNVGSYAITSSGASDNNYSFTYAGGTLTVNKAVLTATAINASREYGDANPAFTVSYSGFKNGETSSVIDALATATSAAGATSNAGTYAITASGASDNNYNFNYVNGTLTVNKAVLTATAGNGTREYGDANPSFTVSYSGFKNGENSSVIDTLATAFSAAGATSNVGSYTTAASGALDNNYTFNYVNGTLTVTKALLTATADNKSRAYGDSNPSFTFIYTGFKNGEAASVIDTGATGTTAANTTSNVGSYAISGSGASDNNYDFAYADGTLTVDKAVVTISADNVSRDQGLANPAFTATYTGFKNGEDVSVIDTQALLTTVATIASPIGTYAITASGGSDNNYSFNYLNGILTVLDPAYVPPPETPFVPEEIMPATVLSMLNGSSVTIFSPYFDRPETRIGNIPGEIAVVRDGLDYGDNWQHGMFLIAMTDSLNDYFFADRERQ